MRRSIPLTWGGNRVPLGPTQADPPAASAKRAAATKLDWIP